MFVKRLQKVGNSYGVTLNPGILASTNLTTESMVKLTTNGKQIIMEGVDEDPFETFVDAVFDEHTIDAFNHDEHVTGAACEDGQACDWEATTSEIVGRSEEHDFDSSKWTARVHWLAQGSHYTEDGLSFGMYAASAFGLLCQSELLDVEMVERAIRRKVQVGIPEWAQLVAVERMRKDLENWGAMPPLVKAFGEKPGVVGWSLSIADQQDEHLDLRAALYVRGAHSKQVRRLSFQILIWWECKVIGAELSNGIESPDDVPEFAVALGRKDDGSWAQYLEMNKG